ncbi:MAG: cyanophycinase [Bacteroidetes bacterium]|jgi:cyanophycinase|nr:cyanophycinase [Bacteroidota bacterium]
MKYFVALSLAILFSLSGFGLFGQSQTASAQEKKGKLYIIGGGKRPVSMIQDIIEVSGIDKQKDYGIVLPMSSSEPDTSFYYAWLSFANQGFERLVNFNIQDEAEMTASRLDSVRNAPFIYLPGGDQSKFVEIVGHSPLHQAILDAYQNGATIAGTSAGAAVQSKKMITGNELKYEKYTGEYRSIEANNIEIAEGLGLLEHAIIDQHFIKRMRMNRLIAAAIENPEELLIGIDESTAILVDGDVAHVRGLSQVVVLRNSKRDKKENKGLLGAEGMTLSIYLPGDQFDLEP